MRLELIFAVAAVVFYVYYIQLRKKTVPRIHFNELAYDRASGRLELRLENKGDKTYYVKPALMVARLTPAEEWKEQTKNGNGIEMAAGKAGNGYSVIKGYDLLGYHENPVPIEPGELKKFVYFLTQDMEIKATDNIRVNLLYGLESSVIDGKIDGNMTVKFDSIEFDYESKTEDADALQETLVEDTLKQEELEILDTPLDGGIAKVETELPLDGGIVEPLLEVPLDGCLDEAICTEKELKGSGFPVEATCFCCGKRKLLKWVFENQHVCDECKEFLKEKYDAKEELKLDLDATQLEILHLLRRDNKLSLDGMSEKLGKNKSTVKRKLKLLLENKQVRREKIGKEYIYYPNE